VLIGLLKALCFRGVGLSNHSATATLDFENHCGNWICKTARLRKCFAQRCVFDAENLNEKLMFTKRKKKLSHKLKTNRKNNLKRAVTKNKTNA
jgi:hypothetical protein